MRPLQKYIVGISFIMVGILFGSCYDARKDLKLVKVTEIGARKIIDSAIVDLLSAEKNIHLSLDFSYSEDDVIEQVRKGEIDLGIIPNNTTFLANRASIRTVVPLLPRVLFVFSKGDQPEHITLSNLVNNKVVGFEPIGATDSIFFLELFQHYDVNPNSFETIIIREDNYQSAFDSLEIFITLSHVHNPLLIDFLRTGGEIFSLGDSDLFMKGSSIDGFCLFYPKAEPFVLPKSMYRGMPEKPILTLAIQDILICREDIDPDITYDIAQVIVENKNRLTQKSRDYGLLDPHFEESSLSFPLHKGARNYLAKNEPTFLQKYAPTIGVTFSILVFISGILISQSRRFRNRRLRRVDAYIDDMQTVYAEVEKGEHNQKEILAQLRAIRARALEAMVKGDLASNESFEILMQLYEQYRAEILNRMKDE